MGRGLRTVGRLRTKCPDFHCARVSVYWVNPTQYFLWIVAGPVDLAPSQLSTIEYLVSSWSSTITNLVSSRFSTITIWSFLPWPLPQVPPLQMAIMPLMDHRDNPGREEDRKLRHKGQARPLSSLTLPPQSYHWIGKVISPSSQASNHCRWIHDTREDGCIVHHAVRRMCIRLLYPHHLDGMWTGQTPQRLTHVTLSIKKPWSLQASGGQSRALTSFNVFLANDSWRLEILSRKMTESSGSM